MKDHAAVIGLGKLGLPLAACLAVSGYRVTGIDVVPDVIRAVNEHRSPYYEPGLDVLVKSAGDRLSATSEYAAALRDADICFIVVPTPSQPDGSFETKYALTAAEQIAGELKTIDSFRLVVLTSTLLPGDCLETIIPRIEEISGKKCGRDFGFCYSPEFIALGSVIRDFTNPDVVLIGESDKTSGDRLEAVYRKVCANDPPIVRTGITNAELAKISLNAFVTMKITFANVLAELAEKIPGGDVDIISTMLGHDSRIGRKYLTGGLAYGGPCFPRDNKAFASVAARRGSRAALAEATNTTNDEQVSRIMGLMEQITGNLKGTRVAVLGVTYKPNTDVVEEAAPLRIAACLRDRGALVSVYDPAGMMNARKLLGDRGIQYAGSVQECLAGSVLCFTGTAWDEFKQLTPEDFRGAMARPCLLDAWRIFNRSEFRDNLDYHAVGLATGSGTSEKE